MFPAIITLYSSGLLSTFGEQLPLTAHRQKSRFSFIRIFFISIKFIVSNLVLVSASSPICKTLGAML